MEYVSKLQRKGNEKVCVFLTRCLLLLLSACFIFVPFAFLVLQLSAAFRGALQDAEGQRVGPWDDGTSSLNIKCVIKKSWPGLAVLAQ